MEWVEIAVNDEPIVRYQKALSASGYHFYKGTWEALTSKTFVCVTQPGKFLNKNVMALERTRKLLLVVLARKLNNKPLKNVLVNYSMTTGPLCSSQNVVSIILLDKCIH